MPFCCWRQAARHAAHASLPAACMHALVPRPGSCASIAPTPSAHTALPAAIILAIVGAFMWFRRRHKKRKRLLAQAPHQPPAAGAPTGEAGSPSFALGAAKLDDMLDSAECGGGTPGAASKAGAVGSVAISAAAAGVAPYAGSDGGTTAASSRIRAVTPQSPYGMQGVADLWAAAAAQSAAAPSAPPPPASPFSSPAATLTEHMQQDEVEMMRLGSTASGSRQGPT